VLRALLSPEGLLEDLVASVNVSEVARRQFRDIARIAGLVLQGPAGRAKTTRQLQASSGLIYDVLSRYDPATCCWHQATREVLEGQLEARRCAPASSVSRRSEIALVAPPRLTPLAFPLWAESLQSHVLSTESWEAARAAGWSRASSGPRVARRTRRARRRGARRDGRSPLRSRGEQVLLHPDRALSWPARRTLVVADVHFGKDDAFRRAGIALPAGAARTDVARLARLLRRTRSERLVVLGDFFHARRTRRHVLRGVRRVPRGASVARDRRGRTCAANADAILFRP
jgi:hypothetical protein